MSGIKTILPRILLDSHAETFTGFDHLLRVQNTHNRQNVNLAQSILAFNQCLLTIEQIFNHPQNGSPECEGDFNEFLFKISKEFGDASDKSKEDQFKFLQSFLKNRNYGLAFYQLRVNNVNGQIFITRTPLLHIKNRTSVFGIGIMEIDGVIIYLPIVSETSSTGEEEFDEKTLNRMERAGLILHNL